MLKDDGKTQLSNSYYTSTFSEKGRMNTGRKELMVQKDEEILEKTELL